MSGDRPGSNKALPPPLQGFGHDDGRRAAAAAAYGKKIEAVELDQLDDSIAPLDRSNESTEKIEHTPADEADTSGRPNLEPVSDNAHPPKNRRMPTQPPSSLVLDLPDSDTAEDAEDTSNSMPTREWPRVSPDAVAPTQPRPPTLNSRHSPAPRRRGLFSTDRPTNVLAGLAIGLLLMIIPAKRLARAYEVGEVEPLLTDLEGAIDHPLGVEAGVVEAPEKIAARIHAGRENVRDRYMMIWLLVGLPIGLGLGFVPRPGD